jgi:hypothetical protein
MSSKEIMNDGCGRISLALAIEVSDALGIARYDMPSAFQARIGNAKGLWIVHRSDRANKERWIETYPSQRKWEMHPENIDVELRTFEVISHSKRLCQAVLNTQFLSLLEAHGPSPTQMQDAIESQLRNGLSYKFDLQKAAMEDSKSLRKWIKGIRSGEQRIKTGYIEYHGGQPFQDVERINMLLDAGFEAKKFTPLKDLVKKIYQKECDMLKARLNITIGQSTYAYMAVDFDGVLGPDEIHLCFSSRFVDEQSNFSGTMLTDMDVLVARSPAHLLSDIQKVRAVFKPELRDLTDVVVFPRRGPVSLAFKLSGGDYDGDKAWICWDPTIVDSFQNIDCVKMPDLVEEGWLQKDKTTFSDLKREFPDTVPKLLEKGFAFNMQENLLGACTTYKEKYCYTKNTVSSPEAILLSALLSNLVDREKQGYLFDWDTFTRVKREKLGNPTLRIPAYKTSSFQGQAKNARHIIDYLRFHVTETVVEKSMIDFHNQFRDDSFFDADLIQPIKWYRSLANNNPELATILSALKADLTEAKLSWDEKFTARETSKVDDSGNHSFSRIFKMDIPDAISACHETFQAIQPKPTSLFVQFLRQDWNQMREYGPWELLRASMAVDLYPMGSFAWRMAGKQLAAIKAFSGRGDGAIVIRDSMYVILKPDANFVKRWAETERGGARVESDGDEESDEERFGFDKD